MRVSAHVLIAALFASATGFAEVIHRDGRFEVRRPGAAASCLSTGGRGLWVVELEGGRRIYAADVAKGGGFREERQKDGVRSVWTSPEIEVAVTSRNRSDGSLSATAKVTVRKGVATGIVFPARLEFATDCVRRFVHPGRGNETTGLAFNRRFFERKLSYEVPYPPLFADWARLETVSGDAVQVFGVQNRGGFEPWKNPKPFVPGRTRVWGEGAVGCYEHAFAIWAKENGSAETPEVRISEGGTLDESLAAYMRENGLGRTLESKCAVHGDPGFLRRLAASPMFLMFGSAKQMMAAMEKVPVPTLLHIHAYLKDGFDHGIPDLLPPNKGFGTLADMTALIDRTHARGNLFMPYTNPCWWCDEPRPETFVRAGTDPLVRRRDGSFQELKYGGKGYNITYFHPAVQAANRKVRTQFHEEYPSDLLFQDQCGSLQWFWDFNAASPSPTAHSEGMISIVEEDCRTMPLMTEDGWDRVADCEVGLTGCAWRVFPLEDMVGRKLFKDGIFPADTYELEPVAQRMFRDKLLFYHHDLAGFTTNERVLAWVLAMGYNIVVHYHADAYLKDPWLREWYGWLHFIQSKVLARTVGGKVGRFVHDRSPLFARPIDPASYDDDGIVEAEYGDCRFSVNLGDVPRTVGGHPLAPYGWWIEGPGVRAGKLKGRKPFVEADGERRELNLPTSKPKFSIRSPRGTVDILKANQRAYLAKPRSERVAMGTNAAARAELAKIGLKPAPVKVEWRYFDRKSGRVDCFRVRISRARDGRLAWQGETRREPCLFCENLEAGTEYVCRVEAIRDGGVVAFDEHKFRTADQTPRILNVQGVSNFRDLGGRRGLGGRRVRQGLVYRSLGLNENARHEKGKPSKPGKSRLTSSVRRYLRDTLGIRTDLDLRDDKETWGMSESPMGPQVKWIHVSANGYHGLQSEKGKEAFAKCFRVFLEDGNYPILFHCMAGADRTGSLAFVLNGLLGVEEEELWKDWEAQMFIDANPDFRHAGRMEALSRDFNALPGKTLADKCESYVLSCGFTKEDVKWFRDKMLAR